MCAVQPVFRDDRTDVRSSCAPDGDCDRAQSVCRVHLPMAVVIVTNC